jgi:molybdopterin-guanine dinucleotide biosynthesis protein A
MSDGVYRRPLRRALDPFLSKAKIKAMAGEAITGFVLAGGKSTRMGKDKAALSLSGRTLLETALEAVRAVADNVFILGSPELYGAYAPTIADVFPGCGPLGGIHAALQQTRTEFNLMIAVDTPFLSAGLLRYLAERALAAHAAVTAPVINAYPQPLCAVYSRAFLPIAERALKAGAYKIVPLFPEDGTLLIPEAELKQVAFTAEMFENLNTPEDLERARRRGPGSNP